MPLKERFGIRDTGLQFYGTTQIPGEKNVWPADEGSGSTAADSVGTFDMNVGVGWVSDSSLVGGYGLDFRNNSNICDLSSSDADSLDTFFQGTDWSLAFTIDQFDPNSYEQILYHSPGSFEMSVSLSNSSSGNIDFGWRSGSNPDTQNGRDISGKSGKTRVFFGCDSNGDLVFSIDGENLRSDGGNTNYSGSTEDFTWGYVSGSDIAYYDGVIDNIKIYDRTPDNDLVSNDYSAQPYS